LLTQVLVLLVSFPSIASRAEAGTVPCSATDLVNAVQAAVNAGGVQTLDLDAGCTYTLTQVNSSPSIDSVNLGATGLPAIPSGTDLTINGNGATIMRDAAAPHFRFFVVIGGGALTLNDVTLTGGRAADAATPFVSADGGAIYSRGDLTIARSTLSNNQSGNGNPAGLGGAVLSSGNLVRILDTIVTNNRTADGNTGAGEDTGGAGGNGGGLYLAGPSIEVIRSEIRNNSAGNGGAPGGNGGNAGGLWIAVGQGGSGFIDRSLIAGNSAGNRGSGIVPGQVFDLSGNGGGILTGGANITIANSTITGNSSGDRVNVITDGNGGGLYNISATSIVNSTLSFNEATGGGDNISGANSVVILRNSIVAGSDQSCGATFGGFTVVDSGTNLDTGTTCGFSAENGSLSNANANLGPLQDNGGPTLTHALLEGSDAIDAGDDATCAAAPVNGVDQRGVARPQGEHCDIGAYEVGEAPPTPSPTPTGSDCAGPSNGRVSCWKGEGNANDSVGTNHGSLMNGATFAEGIDGQAFSFDGSDDFVLVGDTPSLDLPGSLTLAAWIRPNFTEDQMSIISKWGFDAAIDSYLISVREDHRFGGAIGNLVSDPGITVPQTLEADQWYHVAMTYDAEAGENAVYLDGQPGASRSWPGGTTRSDLPVMIGRQAQGPSLRHYRGQIDEVQVWNRALSDAEVQGIFEANAPPSPCAGPSDGRVSCWKGEGNANDSVDGNHGILQNGVTFVDGAVNQAFHFDGVSQFVQTVDAPDLRFEGSDRLSIAAWIRTTATTRNLFVAAKQPNSAPFKGYGLVISNGEAPACDASNPTAPGAGQLAGFLDGAVASTCPPDHNIAVRGTKRLNDGRWHHVAMTYDGSSSAAGVNLYVDGAVESSVVQQDTLGSNTILNNAPFTIGSRENGGVPFDGDIDEVQVYDRTLSAEEIRSIYETSPPPSCDGPRVVWEGNGHTYQAICSEGINWDDAQAEAEARGGYLATITSAEENQFVFSLVDDPVFWYANVFNASIGPWLGAFQEPGAPEPGGFSWVTGEPFSFTAWSGGEPSNSGGTENRIHFYHVPFPGRGSLWNDVSDFVPINGYVIEWEAVPSTPTPSATTAPTDTVPPLSTSTPTATAAPTSTNTVAPTSTSTEAPTPTPSATATAIASATQTATISGFTPTPTRTPKPRPTARVRRTVRPQDDRIPLDDVRPFPMKGRVRINQELMDYDGIEVSGASVNALPPYSPPLERGDGVEGPALVGGRFEALLTTEDEVFRPPYEGGLQGVGASRGAAQPGDLLNVVRGVEGTTPAEHEAGSIVELITEVCLGDCSGDGVVTVDELITGVNIALGTLELDACDAFDGNTDGAVTVDELIAAVNNALSGCT
jgi:hypothetical protein